MLFKLYFNLFVNWRVNLFVIFKKRKERPTEIFVSKDDIFLIKVKINYYILMNLAGDREVK